MTAVDSSSTHPPRCKQKIGAQQALANGRARDRDPPPTGISRRRDVEPWRGPGRARFHDTRHTYASVLLSGGVSVAAAAEYLGHTPGVLLATYAHLLPGDHDRARAVVEAAFAEAGSRVTGVSGGSAG